MPRIARRKSESGIYHIIIRGTNRQEVFHDDEDCIRYLDTIARYKTEVGFRVYGWCLMGNHIHLLLKDGEEEIANIMKRIGVSFVSYYNCKYNTTGHLFQDRFKSEAIEQDKYLLTVVRYIHQNPVKAGIVKRPADWKWSSCSEYYGENVYHSELLDNELVLGLFSGNRDTAIEWFKKFNEAENKDICMDDSGIVRLTDEKAREEIKKAISPLGIVEIKSLSINERKELLSRIKIIKGVRQRQAARILGISQNLIFKA
ncbi:MAG: transposase [Bacillota bacterium]|nr:transposase [Bacillota bacterium]